MKKINGTYFFRGKFTDRILDAIGALFGNRFTGSTWSSRLILLRTGALSLTSIAHELVHRDQDKRLGFFKFRFKYFFEIARVGYFNNPFEIEAREKATTEPYLKEAGEILAIL